MGYSGFAAYSGYEQAATVSLRAVTVYTDIGKPRSFQQDTEVVRFMEIFHVFFL